MKGPCEYCGAPLPPGNDRRERQIRSAHFTQHARERAAEAARSAAAGEDDPRDGAMRQALEALEPYECLHDCISQALKALRAALP